MNFRPHLFLNLIGKYADTNSFLIDKKLCCVKVLSIFKAAKSIGCNCKKSGYFVVIHWYCVKEICFLICIFGHSVLNSWQEAGSLFCSRHFCDFF